jgi:hypothetical protein
VPSGTGAAVETQCLTAAAAAAWGARALHRRGAGGGAVERLRLQRRGEAALLPPPRVFRGQDLASWCRETGREDLLGEWDDPAKGPQDVTRGSSERVWWTCGKEECGHRWGAQVGDRTRGGGCPACAGKVPTATNNFEVHGEEHGMTELLGEWTDRSRRPKDFTPGSIAKVPWQCRECEHEWVSRICSRTDSKQPRGCPACAGRVVTPTNNLAVWCGKNGREDLLGEWAHPDKAPTDFMPGSDVTMPWKCGECEHTWVSHIYSRTNSKHPKGCPACAGQAVTATNNLAVWCGKNGREDLLEEWAHRSRRPKDFTPGSDGKVQWQCRECEHTWVIRIASRTNSKRPSRCPACNPPQGRPRDKVIAP